MAFPKNLIMIGVYKMVNSQDIKVSAFLNSVNIKFNSIFLCSATVDNWERDQWSVSFMKENKTEVFNYFTGIGHRITKKGFHFTNKQKQEIKARKDLDNDQRVSFPVGNNNFVITPTSASVLYCLLLDSQADNDSFNNWCDNFGYESDSIKAFNIYQECCKTAKQMKNIFTYKDIETLNNLLEEY